MGIFREGSMGVSVALNTWGWGVGALVEETSLMASLALGSNGLHHLRAAGWDGISAFRKGQVPIHPNSHHFPTPDSTPNSPWGICANSQVHPHAPSLTPCL